MTVTDKKNQHYIPKFYLRNFSFDANEKQIGIYNIQNNFFFPTSPIKSEGSKNFYYGKDGEIEDMLSNIEGYLTSTIRKIINNKSLPKKLTNEYIELLLFIILTELRNPVQIEQMKEHLSAMKKNLVKLDPNYDAEKYVPNLTHDDVVKLLLSGCYEMIPIISDLEYKLLINKTCKPFVASDFPIIKYNQFLENAKWPLSKTGFGTVGLQIFVPLNHELALVFFDSKIYKVGHKKNDYLIIDEDKDINSLNILQFINCFKTVYFDEKVNKNYLNELANKAKKFKKANLPTNGISHLKKNKEEFVFR